MSRHTQPDHWLTREFAPISLQALNAKAAMLERLDNKYVVRAPVLEAAAAEFVPLFDVLEIEGRRSFTYETCYFDDPERRSYFDHHQGRRQRMKVRVRRYVDAGLVFLEVKLKDKRGVTVKKRLRVDDALFDRLDDTGLAFVQACWQQMYGSAWTAPLAPVLQMSYRRITLVAHEGGERMTIDTGIHFQGQWAAREARRTDDEVFILETKSANGRGLADRVLRAHHQHPTNGCSKYCVGMSLTGAVDRYNRFRPALRKLGAWPSLDLARLPAPVELRHAA
jgi:hypothetical protein